MNNKPLTKDVLLDTMSLEEIEAHYKEAMATVINCAGAIVQSKEGGTSPNMFAVAGFITMNLPANVASCYQQTPKDCPDKA